MVKPYKPASSGARSVALRTSSNCVAPQGCSTEAVRVQSVSGGGGTGGPRLSGASCSKGGPSGSDAAGDVFSFIYEVELCP